MRVPHPAPAGSYAVAVLRSRPGLTGWLVTALVVATVVALVAALGGWRTADARAARLRQPGEVLAVRGWQVVVHEAQVVNFPVEGSYASTESQLRVLLDVTATGQESEDFFRTRLLQVQLPDGTLLPDGYVDQAPPWGGAWDPDITFPSVLEVDLPDLALDDPAPEQVRLLLHDQRPSRSFLSDDGELAVGGARWRLELSTVDRRIPVTP